MKKPESVIVSRQGDIAFIQRAKPPGGLRVKRQNGRLVLAEGEATGHEHAVRTKGAELWNVGGELFLICPKNRLAVVEHDEHDSVELHGEVQVVRQTEYDGEQERVVAD